MKKKKLSLIIKKILIFDLDPNELGIFSQDRFRESWYHNQANIQQSN